MEWKFNWVDPFINKEVIPPWAQRLQATRTRSLRIISCFPLLRICWLGSLFTPQCLLFVGSLRLGWAKFCSCICTDDAGFCSPKGLKVNRKRGYSLITYHISISDTHSSPIIYLYTSIDLTFGLLNVEGIHQSPPIAMLHPFSKHLLKAVRMINNNKDGCAITSCRERGCSGWSWEAEIQDCDLRPPKYMWTSLQPVGIKRHILWRLEIYLDWRSVGVYRLDQASQPPYSKDSEWHIGTYGWTWRC